MGNAGTDKLVSMIFDTGQISTGQIVMKKVCKIVLVMYDTGTNKLVSIMFDTRDDYINQVLRINCTAKMRRNGRIRQ